MSELQTYCLGIPRHVSIGRLPDNLIDGLCGCQPSQCAACGSPLLVWKITDAVEDMCGTCTEWSGRIGRATIDAKAAVLTLPQLLEMMGEGKP